jgi:hypothetical protein
MNDKSWGAGIYEFYRHHLPHLQASVTPSTPVKHQVQNSYQSYDDTPILIATKVKEGNEQLKIRDSEGYPLWMGWQKIE